MSFLQVASDQAPIFLQADVPLPAPHHQTSLQGLMEMMAGVQKPRPAMLKNPCSEDMARTGCKDALCLKKHAEDLSGGCAELLLKAPRVPEPSPAPLARGHGHLTDLVSLLLGKDAEAPRAAPMPVHLAKPRLVVEDRRRAEQDGATGGFFEVITTDEEGHSRTVHGPISGAATLPPELALMMNMMPDIDSLLGDLSSLVPFVEKSERATKARSHGPVASIGDDPRDVAAARMMAREEKAAVERYPTASIGGVSYHAVEEPQDSSHPCDAEITHCQEVMHSTASDDVKQCILQNFEKLSAKCKCFVHQVEGDRVLPSSSKAAAAPILHVASVPDVIVTVTEVEPAFRRGAPHFPCVLFTFLMFVGLAIALRRCLVCCCSRPTTSTLAVVVPPEHTTIKLVEPLMAVDIKTVPVAEKK